MLKTLLSICLLDREAYVPWLTCDWVLSMFSDNVDIARTNYRAFVDGGIMEERRKEFHVGTCEGRILGNDTFTDEVLRNANQLRQQAFSIDDVVNAVCRQFGITEELMKAPGKTWPFTEARALSALIVLESGHLSLTGLGRMLNRDIAPLGRSGRLLGVKAGSDNQLAATIEAVKKDLSK